MMQHPEPMANGGRVSEQRHYDVIVIGTGAGGGTLAHRLAPSGLRVLRVGDHIAARMT